MNRFKFALTYFNSGASATFGVINLPYNNQKKQTSLVDLSDASEETKKILKKIDDYSFKIFMPCNVGTGWILDYIIPEDGSYPTTWFIATNAHVVNKYKFKNESYKQEIPIKKNKQIKVPKDISIKYSNVDLFSSESCSFSNKYHFNGFSLSKASTGKTFKSNKDFISRKYIKQPKLFYVATNFLKKKTFSKYQDYQKDFAVLEIVFTSSEIARKLTNDFHKKYNKDNALNPFNKNITAQDINNLDIEYYSFAYPTLSGKPFNYSTNFDLKSKKASKLIYPHYAYSVLDDNYKLIKGYASSEIIENVSNHSKTIWNNKTMKNFGHHYVLDNMNMGSGSSGGIFADKEGNILGINRLYDPINKHAFVEPLIADSLITDTKEIFPKYDLIRGGDGQISSYKTQLEKYHSGKTTFLSSRNWE